MRAFVADVLAFCDGLRARTGWHPAVLDLGGSLACPTVGADPDAAVPAQPRARRRPAGARSAATHDASPRRRRSPLAPSPSTSPPLGLAVPSVVLEPGRALTSSTQLLLARVVDVKDDGPLAHAVLDAGINVAEPVRGEFHQLFSVSAPGRAGDDALSPRRPDLHAGRRALQQLAAAAADAWPRARRHGHRRLLRARSRRRSRSPSRRSSWRRKGTLSVCRRAETFADVVALDEPFKRPGR